jgi:hypothetical protein
MLPRTQEGAVAALPSDGTGGRLRLVTMRLDRRPSGHSKCEVALQWHEGQRVVGCAEGLGSPQADLRLAAEATLRALRSFHGEGMRLELLGIKTLHAFDAIVVIACVAANRRGESLRLLGCHLSEGDTLRSAVLAVLHATNRIAAPAAEAEGGRKGSNP